MSSTIWIKVVGFSTAERHSLNTLMRLSSRQTPCYAVWTPECPTPAHLWLVDMDAHEAEVALASPAFNPHQKVVAVGRRPLTGAYRTFRRPVDWTAMVQVLDGLFVSPPPSMTIDTGFEDLGASTVPPGVRVSLLVGMRPEERFYLRARLALAGLTDVDECQTAERARACIARRHYDVVVVSLELEDMDTWALLTQLQAEEGAAHALIVTTSKPSWAVMEKAEAAGCIGLLEIPFNPPQVASLLQKV